MEIRYDLKKILNLQKCVIILEIINVRDFAHNFPCLLEKTIVGKSHFIVAYFLSVLITVRKVGLETSIKFSINGDKPKIYRISNEAFYIINTQIRTRFISFKRRHENFPIIMWGHMADLCNMYLTKYLYHNLIVQIIQI